MEKIKLESVNDEFLEFVNGGTYAETQELVDWCNRHGADITMSKNAPSEIYYFLVVTFPELGLYGGTMSTGNAPNNISGMSHEYFMNLLRSKYGN